MIDPQARPGPYIKLLALVVLLGLVSTLITFTFIALVHEGTHLLWTEAALGLGVDQRLFTIFVCTLGGLLVGLLVKVFGDHNAIICRPDDRIWQDRALRLSSRTRNRYYCLCIPYRWRQPGTRGTPRRCLRWDWDLGFRSTQARRKGDSSDFDSTAAEALENLDADLERRGVELWIARANKPLRDLLQVTGLTTRIGKENIYVSVRAAVTAYHARFGTT